MDIFGMLGAKSLRRGRGRASRRGYVLCSFNRQRCEAAFRAIDHVSKPGGTVDTIETVEVDTVNQGIF